MLNNFLFILQYYAKTKHRPYMLRKSVWNTQYKTFFYNNETKNTQTFQIWKDYPFFNSKTVLRVQTKQFGILFRTQCQIFHINYSKQNL